LHTIEVQELKKRLDQGERVALIDVREPYEHEEFNIGGENLPLGEIMSWSESLQVPRDTEIVVYCRSGNRSEMAQSFLASRGFTAVRNLTGGIIAWKKS
jgi:rhodanese-related sulfurtransferase